MYFSSTTNNYKSKIKSKKISSTTPNTKVNQNQGKIRKLHRSPLNTLNKSQNFAITKKKFESNIKIKNINNPIQINPKKIFPMHNPKNLNFIYKKNLKLNPFLYNNNRSSSKTNSFSNYFVKTSNKITHNLRKNHSNTNIINITNTNTSNFNEFLKNNYFYNAKPNNIKKRSLIKIRDIMNNDDLSISKNNNKNGNFYPLVITEESKKNNNEIIGKKKIKKSESSFNSCIKNNYPPIKHLKASSTTMIGKPNFIINNNQNKQGINNPIIINNLIDNISSSKISGNAYLETLENKIINEIKEFKNYKNNEIMDKVKIIFEEVLEYLVPKESQNIFSMLLKEIYNINREYLDNINQLDGINEKYKIKINCYEKKYKELAIILNNKEKEINNLKKEIENIKNEKKIFHNLKIDKNCGNNAKKKIKKNHSLANLEIRKDNNSIKKINAINIDDLYPLYFLDKINYIQNDAEKEMPKLNLEQKYIEKCIKKEIIKRNEVKLTPFQKIALQFEMPDS